MAGRVWDWWLTVTGRADGDQAARCVQCDAFYPRAEGVKAAGAPGLACSEDCAEEAVKLWAW